MARGRVRLRDIAEKTGFSANTVSLALRDSPRIPEATRILIRATAEELNYLPNRIAQSLVTAQSMTVGLVLTDIRNPVLTNVAEKISSQLSEQGYSTLFATSGNDLNKEIEVVRTFRARQADGILIYPTDHRKTDHLKTLREEGYPVMSLVAGVREHIDSVSIDEVEGSRKIIAHLIEQGIRKIGILDAASPLGNTEKRQGYQQALKNAGIAVEAALEVQVDGHGIAEGHEAIARLWASGARPRAVFATNDMLALGVLRWSTEQGLKVPEALIIAGFDDIEFARLASVPISSVCYPVNRIAKTAVENLIKLIETDGPLPSPTQTLFEPDIAVRASTRK